MIFDTDSRSAGSTGNMFHLNLGKTNLDLAHIIPIYTTGGTPQAVSPTSLVQVNAQVMPGVCSGAARGGVFVSGRRTGRTVFPARALDVNTAPRGEEDRCTGKKFRR